MKHPLPSACPPSAARALLLTVFAFSLPVFVSAQQGNQASASAVAAQSAAQSEAQSSKIDPGTGAPVFAVGQKSSAATEAAPAQQATQTAEGSLHQGLTVHGHWVINVRNPDGTLAQHREFANSLQNSAQGFLVGLLSGYMVPGDWMIVLGAQNGNGPCTATYQYCGLVHNTATYPAMGYCGIYYCTGSNLSYTYNFGSGFTGPTPLC
jgi:hypothetical protein